MDSKKVTTTCKPFDTIELLKSIEKIQEMKVPILIKINYLTYSMLKQNNTNSKQSLFSIPVEVDNSVAYNKAKVIFSNGDEEEIKVFK